MKKVPDIFKEKQRTYSFEFFPPKTPQGDEKLDETLAEMALLKPDFMTVTYGAGGSSRTKTFGIVKKIQEKHHLSGVAHLTCVCHTKNELKDILEEIKQLGIRNILALRGDPPKDNPDWKPGPDNFQYSSELCAFARKHFGDYFGIGVAGFPEGHILSPDRETDARYLKTKIDAGADFVVTQLFFDNKDYFEYVARLRKLDVTARVIPGVITITDYQGILKFAQLCGAIITPEVRSIFEPIQNDKEAMLREGIKFAIRQCRELLAGGAPGLHFYTLNKLHPTDEVLKAVRI